MEPLYSQSARTEKVFSEINTKLAAIENLLTEIKKILDEDNKRNTAFLPQLLAGFVGGNVALLGQFLIEKLFP